MIRSKTVIVIIMMVFFFVGTVLLCVGLGVVITDKKKRNNCTIKTTGTVVKMEMETTTPSVSEAPIVSWYPTFEYSAHGNKINKRSNIGGPKDDLFVGQIVTVYYNPANPNEYYVVEQNTRLFEVVFIGIAAVCLLIGSGCFIAMKVLIN